MANGLTINTVIGNNPASQKATPRGDEPPRRLMASSPISAARVLMARWSCHARRVELSRRSWHHATATCAGAAVWGVWGVRRVWGEGVWGSNGVRGGREAGCVVGLGRADDRR